MVLAVVAQVSRRWTVSTVVLTEQSADVKIVCPECKGLRWVSTYIWEPRLQDLAAVTIDCTWCHGRGWLYQSEDDENGRGYDRVIG